MISSNAFNYIDVLDKAMDASWERETILANNLANVNTPNYKRQDLDFEAVLRSELGKSKYTSLDSKIDDIHMHHLTPRIYTDYANFSYRLDKNNVDVDTENVELASEQIRYRTLEDAIDFDFSGLKTAMQSGS